MRGAVGILSIALGPVFVASLALAADPYPPGSGQERHEHGTTAGTAAMAGFMGQHTMTGRITDIDKDKGNVTIESQGEELEQHFPASALQTLDKGDEVTVALGIKPVSKAGTRSGTSGTSGTSGGAGMGTGPGSRGTDMPHDR